MSNEENIRELQNLAEYDRINAVSMKEFDQFKADISKVLFTITERLSRLEDITKCYMLNLNDLYKKQEEKIAHLDQERLFLEGRIQTLERFTQNLNTLHESHTAEILQNMRDIKTLQDDLTTWIEDSELQVEAATNPEDYERDTYIERAKARKEARD